MKSYKQILSEVAQPKPADEINFKAKHEIEFMDHPASEEGQHSSNKKKAKRIADYEEGEDMGVYEDADEENSMYKTQLEFIKYAADEIMEYVSTGIDTEEWFQNKLAKVHGDMTTLHAYMEGDKRKNDGIGVNEAEMTADQKKKREEIVLAMKDNKADMKKRYGDDWESVMYATATKQAMKEYVDLDEAAQPKWEVIVRKSFTTNGKTAKKGSSVEVSARNTAEAIDKATKKMGFGDKAVGISGSNFDLKKLKETIDLDEAVKSGNVKLNDGTRVSVSKDDADAINNLFDNLSPNNKKSMETTMLKDKKSFDEIMNFAREAM